MGKFIDLTGKIFGRLSVIDRSCNNNNGRVMWRCKCTCGEEKVICASSLKYGATKSCGCLHSEVLKKRSTTHGLSKTPIYEKWCRIKDRCNNPKCECYSYYGGRGINLCDEWVNDPKKFVDWAKKNGWRKGLEIDRIDNDKGYSPGNCRFVSRTINMHNTRLTQKNNTTGFTGVFLDRGGKYTAIVYFKNRINHLGMFFDPVSAAIARDIFLMDMGLNEKPLNFPALKRR